MKWFKTLKIAAPIVLFSSIISVMAIVTFDKQILRTYKIFEIFGALLASVITTFGIINMKKITEE